MSVRSIIKQIFPKVLLKNAFSVYNAIRIFTIDRFLFPEYIVKRHQFLVYRIGYPFRENAIDLQNIYDTKVRLHMQKWYDWTQEEFILHFDIACYIEPDQGWAIILPNRLLYYSLGISRTWFLPKPRLFKFLKRKSVVRLTKAISLRDTGEENYFHFYNDVLAKLFFLKENSVDITQTPIIISKKLWDKPFFKFYLKHQPELNSLNWVVQDKEYIHCERITFCKPLTHRTDLLKKVFSPLYQAPIDSGKKIFLTRNKKRMRHIVNSAEIEALFIHYGFEIVDSDLLQMEQQVEIFANAKVIVGIHGAGLTNLMLRNGECLVLEIFPHPENDYLPFHYIMLSKMKGFSYQAVIGEKSRARFSMGFYVNANVLEENLTYLLR